MKLKLDENGHAVLENGLPVWVADDGKEIPYVTSYELTRTVGNCVLLKLALSVADVDEVVVESDKIVTDKK